jgi:hypothetical protein
MSVQIVTVGQQQLDNNSSMSKQQRLDSNNWTATVGH